MAHQLFQLPKATPLNTGTIMPGAEVSFFLTGTSTPTPVYTDSGLSIAHTQPVVASAAGILAPIYLDPAIVYKATITGSDDVLLYTVDPVNDQLLSQAIIGGYLYPRTDAEVSAGVTPVNYAYPPGDVRRYGTNTTPGVTDMTSAFQSLADVLNEAGGGTAVLYKENYLVWVGSSPNLMTLTGCDGVTIEGNGATFVSGRTNGPGCFLLTLDGCNKTILKNFTVQGSNTTLTNSTGEAIINIINGTVDTTMENVHSKDCAAYCQAGPGNSATPSPLTGRVRGIKFLNCTIEDTYYGLGLTGDGDDVFARGVKGINTGRVYFAYNVKNHDVEIDGQQEGPFSDCLLKAYGQSSSSYYSGLENIRLRYRSAGKSVNATGSGSSDALISIEPQLAASGGGACFMRNIDIEFNIDCNNNAGSAKIFHIFNMTKFDGSGNPDTTARGHEFDNFRISGYVRNWQNTGGAAAGLNAVTLFDTSDYGGGIKNWTGDFATNILVENLKVHDTSVTPAYAGLLINGQPFTSGKAGLCLRNVDCTAARVTRQNWSSSLDFAATNVRGQTGYINVPTGVTSYTPTFTSSAGSPNVGNGSLTGRYRRSEDMVEVWIHFQIGSTTNVGTGNNNFSLPFIADGDSAAGNGIMQDSGGNSYITGVYVFDAESIMRPWYTAGGITGASPMTWSTNDVLDFYVRYKAKTD